MGHDTEQVKDITAWTLIAFGLFLFYCLPYAFAADIKGDGEKIEAEGQKKVAHLYFSDKMGRYLVSEDRTVALDNDPLVSGAKIISEILAGPQKDLAPTFTGGVALRAFYISGTTAYVDLDRQSAENHPGGCRFEMLSLFSIVNSLILNVPEIESVKILIQGGEVITFSGHIDLAAPFKADMLLIR